MRTSVSRITNEYDPSFAFKQSKSIETYITAETSGEPVHEIWWLYKLDMKSFDRRIM